MFKRKKTISHDVLCVNNPCICSELNYLREIKAAETAVKEIASKNYLARQLLEGQNK